MNYFLKYKRPLIVQQPIMRNGQQYYEILDETLEKLHLLALEQLELSSADFEIEDGYPKYWLPISQQHIALSKGAHPVAWNDEESTVLRANLSLQLYSAPHMGLDYALKYEKSVMDEGLAETAKADADRARRIAFVTRQS